MLESEAARGKLYESLSLNGRIIGCTVNVVADSEVINVSIVDYNNSVRQYLSNC